MQIETPKLDDEDAVRVVDFQSQLYRATADALRSLARVFDGAAEGHISAADVVREARDRAHTMLGAMNVLERTLGPLSSVRHQA